MNRREGKLGVYVGSSRMGKTSSVKQELSKCRRVVVWTPKEAVDKYAQAAKLAPPKVVYHIGDLTGAMAEAGKGPAYLVYQPSAHDKRLFTAWSKAVMAWGKLAPCDAAADEIADVTTPGKAPPGWGELIRQGLGWGINVYAITQRPAESDKTVFGNASYIRVHRQALPADREYMARFLPGETVESLGALKPLQWVQVTNTGEKKRGVLTFKTRIRGGQKKAAGRR